MARTVVITQPNYLLWLGYFQQVAEADVFIFLDTVQYIKREWQNRNRLQGTNGEPFWLTVPVMAHPRGTPLSKIRISSDRPRWREEHLRSIQMHLGGAPYFTSLFPQVQEWLSTEYEYLVDLNIAGIKLFSRILELSPEFLRASDLNPEGRKTRLLVNLCKQVHADRYCSSAGAKAYMEEEEHLFADAGIRLFYQTWEHPVCPQQRGNDFVSHLSVVDALMNVGPEATRSLIVVNNQQ